MATGKALLFGLNYAHCTSGALKGCVEDVRNMAAFLRGQGLDVMTYTDDDVVTFPYTTGKGIIQRLYEVAVETWQKRLDFVWVHYSGHGSYTVDGTDADERDGQDECLVPSDYETHGFVRDDVLNSVFAAFNPKTRVVFVFDCCHSATIGDLRFSWEGKRATVENACCKARAKVLSISGCLDSQTSADAFNVNGSGKYSGAMTSCLLAVLNSMPKIESNVFNIVDALRLRLRREGFPQVPKLCSSYDLTRDTVLFKRTSAVIQTRDIEIEPKQVESKTPLCRCWPPLKSREAHDE